MKLGEEFVMKCPEVNSSYLVSVQFRAFWKSSYFL